MNTARALWALTRRIGAWASRVSSPSNIACGPGGIRREKASAWAAACSGV